MLILGVKYFILIFFYRYMIFDGFDGGLFMLMDVRDFVMIVGLRLLFFGGGLVSVLAVSLVSGLVFNIVFYYEREI